MTARLTAAARIIRDALREMLRRPSNRALWMGIAAWTGCLIGGNSVLAGVLMLLFLIVSLLCEAIEGIRPPIIINGSTIHMGHAAHTRDAEKAGSDHG